MRVKAILSRFILALFILDFCIITINVIVDIVQAGYYISFLITFLIAGLIIFRYPSVFKGWPVISDSCLKIIQAVAHILSFLLMLVIVWYGQVELTWDWGQLIRTATKITLENINDNPSYYLRYPNNQFWLAVLTVFFKTVRRILPAVGNYSTGLRYVSSLLSIFLVRSSILIFYYSAKISFGIRHARLLDIALLTFSPIYLYAGFAYTDTAGLLCVSLLILQFLKLRAVSPRSRSYLRKLIMYSLAAALAFRVKVMSFIVFLATTLGVLLHQKIRFQSAVREVAAAALLCTLLVAVLSRPIHYFTLLPDDRMKADQFPLEHWIVMGFNHYGGYSQEDVDYSKSFDSYDARRDALRARLIGRLTGRTLTENIHFIFHTKLNRTWGNALLAGDDYMSRSALFPESLVQRIWGWYGDLHDYCKIPAYGFWLLLVTGCLLSGVFSMKSASINYLHLSLLGIFIFLSFWECNSRYLFTVTPVLFLCSFKGWNDCSSWLWCHSHLHGNES